MLRALAEARARHPEKFRPVGIRGEWADLAHLLSLTPQIIWNWRRRNLPTSAVMLMADVIGCSVESLRAKSPAARGKPREEAELTQEEAILIAHYRNLDERRRETVFRLVTDQDRPPQPSAPQPERQGVAVLRRNRGR